MVCTRSSSLPFNNPGIRSDPSATLPSPSAAFPRKCLRLMLSRFSKNSFIRRLLAIGCWPLARACHSTMFTFIFLRQSLIGLLTGPWYCQYPTPNTHLLLHDCLIHIIQRLHHLH